MFNTPNYNYNNNNYPWNNYINQPIPSNIVQHSTDENLPSRPLIKCKVLNGIVVLLNKKPTLL